MTAEKCHKAISPWVHWIESFAANRFKPWIVESLKHRVNIGFAGVDNRIRASMSSDGCAILYVEGGRGEIHDIILDLDMTIVANQTGFSCKLCENGDVFPSVYALWDDHVFSPISSWFQAHQNDHIFLRQLADGGATWFETVKVGQTLRRFANGQIVEIANFKVVAQEKV